MRFSTDVSQETKKFTNRHISFISFCISPIRYINVLSNKKIISILTRRAEKYIFHEFLAFLLFIFHLKSNQEGCPYWSPFSSFSPLQAVLAEAVLFFLHRRFPQKRAKHLRAVLYRRYKAGSGPDNILVEI